MRLPRRPDRRVTAWRIAVVKTCAHLNGLWAQAGGAGTPFEADAFHRGVWLRLGDAARAEFDLGPYDPGRCAADLAALAAVEHPALADAVGAFVEGTIEGRLRSDRRHNPDAASPRCARIRAPLADVMARLTARAGKDH